MRFILLNFAWLFFFPLTLPAQTTDASCDKPWLTTAADELSNASRHFSVKSGSVTKSSNNFDIHYEKLFFNINPHQRKISGRLSFYFTPTVANLQNLILDCSDSLQIDSVVYHQAACLFQRTEKDALSISIFNILPIHQIDSFTIFYHGIPEYGIGFKSFMTDTINGSAVLWTLSEPYGAKDWMPCKQNLQDKTDSLDIWITCPDSFQTAANGLLVDTVQTPGKITYHWKHRYPIATYLIAIACARYHEFYDTIYYGTDLLRMQNFVYPAWDSVARVACKGLVKTMEFYETLLGPYPFRKEKYGHAQFGWRGGMEHQTHTFVGGFGTNLLAHELAHQWFGDKVTCGSWTDIWLNEGFATYFAGLADAHSADSVRFADWRWSSRDVLLKSPPGAVLCDDTSKVERIFSSLYSYNKGAWALHQLRLQLGDSSFFKAIRNYLNDTRLSYNFSHTALLREHFEAQYGQSLKNYFAIWVEQKEIPAYQVYWWQEDNGEVSIRVLMNTKNDTIANCTLPLPFEWSEQWDGKADSSFIIKPQFADQVFHFKTSKKLKRVSLDPNANILATINCEQQAVSGMQAATKIQVLPNPASDFIYINAQANSLVSVYFYSLDGKLVAMQNLEKNATLLGITKCSIQALPVGFYVIRMVSSEGNNYFSELLKK